MSDPICDLDLAEDDYGETWVLSRRIVECDRQLARLREQMERTEGLKAGYAQKLAAKRHEEAELAGGE